MPGTILYSILQILFKSKFMNTQNGLGDPFGYWLTFPFCFFCPLIILIKCQASSVLSFDLSFFSWRYLRSLLVLVRAFVTVYSSICTHTPPCRIWAVGGAGGHSCPVEFVVLVTLTLGSIFDFFLGDCQDLSLFCLICSVEFVLLIETVFEILTPLLRLSFLIWCVDCSCSLISNVLTLTLMVFSKDCSDMTVGRVDK